MLGRAGRGAVGEAAVGGGVGSGPLKLGWGATPDLLVSRSIKAATSWRSEHLLLGPLLIDTGDQEVDHGLQLPLAFVGTCGSTAAAVGRAAPLACVPSIIETHFTERTYILAGALAAFQTLGGNFNEGSCRFLLLAGVMVNTGCQPTGSPRRQTIGHVCEG